MKGTFTTTNTNTYRPRCARPGCDRPARTCSWATAGHSRYCERCRSHARKHGDPAQVPIRKPQVKTVVKRIKKLLKRGNIEKVGAYLRERATLLREVVESPEAVEVPTTTRPRIWVVGWKAQAVDEMLKVLNDSDPVESGLLVAAMFLLRVEQPRLFASDEGFDYELVRMFRAQTRMSFGSYYYQEKDCVVYVHKVLPARVTEYMAEFLVATYSRFGGHVCTAVEKERKWQAEHEQKLVEGFESLLK